MKKNTKATAVSSIDAFLKKIKPGLLNKKEMKYILGGAEEEAAQPKPSKTRPLTGLYGD